MKRNEKKYYLIIFFFKSPPFKNKKSDYLKNKTLSGFQKGGLSPLKLKYPVPLPTPINSQNIQVFPLLRFLSDIGQKRLRDIKNNSILFFLCGNDS